MSGAEKVIYKGELTRLQRTLCTMVRNLEVKLKRLKDFKETSKMNGSCGIDESWVQAIICRQRKTS